MPPFARIEHVALLDGIGAAGNGVVGEMDAVGGHPQAGQDQVRRLRVGAESVLEPIRETVVLGGAIRAVHAGRDLGNQAVTQFPIVG